MRVCVNACAFQLQQKVVELTRASSVALGNPDANSLLIPGDDKNIIVIGVVNDDSIDCYMLDDASMTEAELRINFPEDVQVFRDFDNFKKFYNEAVANASIEKSNNHFSDELNANTGSVDDLFKDFAVDSDDSSEGESGQDEA